MHERPGACLVDLRPLREDRGTAVEVDVHRRIASGLDDLVFDQPVAARLTLRNLGAAVRIDGRIHTSVELDCDLCATRFRAVLDATVEEELRWSDAAPSVGTAEGAYLIRVGDTLMLDVETLARDALILALPMVARCRSDCEGLCPQCGADRHAGACRCETAEPADPRLAPLAALLGDGPAAGVG